MHRTKQRQFKISCGFSLVETLLALTLGVLVLSSLLALFFSFLQVWTGNSQQKEFKLHVDGVCDFLEKSLNGLSFPLEGWPEAQPITWKRFSNPKDTKSEMVLAATLRQGPVFLQSADGFSTSVVAYFHHQPSKGLFMTCEGNIWKKTEFSLSDLPKESYQKERFLISPWIAQWRYGYYDRRNQKWHFVETALKDKETKKERIPNCIRINFEHDSLKETRYIRINKLNPLFVSAKHQTETEQKQPEAKVKKKDEKENP